MVTEMQTNPTSLGKLPDGWQVQSIESLCQRVTSGGTPLRSNKKFYNNGAIRWVKTGELKDWYIDDTEEKITIEAVKKSSAKILPANTVLMAMYGDGKTITSLGILRNEAATNQACCALITNPNVCHYLYLFYALKYHRTDFIQIATGGAQRNLSGVLIRNFAIKVPPLSEQETIAHILSSFDDKIEVNRRMNETSESIAKAIFKSWFVDFDPVRAKMDGRKPYGMNDKTTILFPIEFEDSVLGKIPKGWKVGIFADIMNITSGKRPKERSLKTTTETSIPLYGGGGVMGYVHEPLYERPILLTGRVGTLGEVYRVSSPCWPSDNTLVILDKSEIYCEYNYFQLLNIDFNSLNRGSTQPLVTQEDLKKQHCLYPDRHVLNAFHQTVKPLFQAVDLNIQQSNTLSMIRDLLMLKLISGKIRVKEAEKYAEAHL